MSPEAKIGPVTPVIPILVRIAEVRNGLLVVLDAPGSLSVGLFMKDVFGEFVELEWSPCDPKIKKGRETTFNGTHSNRKLLPGLEMT